MDNVHFSTDYVASDLLDSHVRGNNKLPEPAMERSATSLDANSVDVSTCTMRIPTSC